MKVKGNRITFDKKINPFVINLHKNVDKKNQKEYVEKHFNEMNIKFKKIEIL